MVGYRSVHKGSFLYIVEDFLFFIENTAHIPLILPAICLAQPLGS